MGVYKHFKGNLYKVLDLVRNADTMEYQVLYSALYTDKEKSIFNGSLFVREIKDFKSDVDKRKYPFATQDKRFAYQNNM